MALLVQSSAAYSSMAQIHSHQAVQKHMDWMLVRKQQPLSRLYMGDETKSRLVGTTCKIME